MSSTLSHVLPRDGHTGDVQKEIVEKAKLNGESRLAIADFAGSAGWALQDLTDIAIREYEQFWMELLRWSGVRYEGDTDPICTSSSVEEAVFFPGVRLNYTDAVLSLAFDESAVCLTAVRSGGGSVHLTRFSLRREVERCAGLLRDMGLRPGDRVGAITRNSGEAIIAALAVAALGGVYASTSPEMGADAIVDRLGQVEPRFLIANVEPRGHDGGLPVRDRVFSAADRLESLEALLLIDGDVSGGSSRLPVSSLHDFHGAPIAQADWPRLPFNHPLFVMFSSGTTAKPKCLIHGAGGVLLEHIKEHRLHCDMRPSDTLFFHTSCAWMMWNWQLSAMASGVRIVTYDGPVDQPDTLWAVAARERATIFGTSPSYLRLCSDAGISPVRELALHPLRTLLSTGSILYDDQFAWVREHVGDVAIQSISGGSDILGCFVLGHPLAPERDGECQSRSLAMDVRAFGSSLANPVGELVCANPFPSRPLGMIGDPQGERFHATYFERVPGMWAHGDLISFSPAGGARLHGRVDNIMNIRGIRLSPAEIYTVVFGVPGVSRAAAIQYHPPSSEEPLLMLLVVLDHGTLDRTLATRIRRSIRHALSASHVPDILVQVSDLPITHSGKESELSVSDAVHGRPIRNLYALANPSCLPQLRDILGKQGVTMPKADVDAGRGSLIEQMREIWTDVLHAEHVGVDDDFFDLGGSSLAAARLVAALSTRLRTAIPMSLVFQAPTIRTMASSIEASTIVDLEPLAVLKPGTSAAPIVLVHSSTGTLFNLLPLVRALRVDSIVYGISADIGDAPDASVEQLADRYLKVMAKHQLPTPSCLIGYSFGGLVVFEMARQLARQSGSPPKIIMIDGVLHGSCLPPLHKGVYLIRKTTRTLVRLLSAARQGQKIVLNEADEIAGRLEPEARLVHDVLHRARRRYRPAPLNVSVTYIQPERPLFDAVPAWRSLTDTEVVVRRTEGDHMTMMSEHADQVARIVEEVLPDHVLDRQ